ncbi:hypothetical protein [Chengkuizengella marina]|uniref:Uncharacterized protein n=1 Tax=Chengkuizengella marina TaxID=2507566 RepID=A0A6N9PW98_9BACL|nr:hypothetical protein [Chengkuizengella marina]NBI27791.1 hypothetical protein [Chengkuizengella marina]
MRLFYKIFILILIVIFGIINFINEDIDRIEVIYLKERSDYPESFLNNIQPTESEDGVKQKLTSCKNVGGDIEYTVQFDNPYTNKLNGVVGFSLDGPANGSIWGFFKVPIVPGKTKTIISTNNLPDVDRTRIVEEVIPRIQHEVNVCSIHLIVFEESIDGNNFHIESTIVTTDLK